MSEGLEVLRRIIDMRDTDGFPMLTRKDNSALRALIEEYELLEEIAEAAAHHLAGYDGDYVSRAAKDLGQRRDKVEELLRDAEMYPPPQQKHHDWPAGQVPTVDEIKPANDGSGFPKQDHGEKS